MATGFTGPLIGHGTKIGFNSRQDNFYVVMNGTSELRSKGYCNTRMDLKYILKTALDRALSAEEYDVMLHNYAREGKTSGDQKEDLIHYTKLNAQRSKRITKTSVLKSELIERVKHLPKQTWLLITETWCGDAANSVPLIAKLAALNDHIDLKVVMRDENTDLMDQFLTKGGRSIPKLIGLDEELNVLFDWGPRPQEAQELYWSWRESENRIPYSEFHVVMQKWYNDNKSKAVQSELLDKIEGIKVLS